MLGKRPKIAKLVQIKSRTYNQNLTLNIHLYSYRYIHTQIHAYIYMHIIGQRKTTNNEKRFYL